VRRVDAPVEQRDPDGRVARGHRPQLGHSGDVSRSDGRPGRR
jgi:hypothetical protein